jgi:hypothetical protein
MYHIVLCIGYFLKCLDHIILSYYIQNLTTFINLQTDEYQKINIVYLIINIINHLFNQFNAPEQSKYFIEAKKLLLYLKSNAETVDFEDSGLSDLSPEQLAELKEQSLDSREEEEALDIDYDEMDENDDNQLNPIDR